MSELCKLPAGTERRPTFARKHNRSSHALVFVAARLSSHQRHLDASHCLHHAMTHGDICGRPPLSAWGCQLRSAADRSRQRQISTVPARCMPPISSTPALWVADQSGHCTQTNANISDMMSWMEGSITEVFGDFGRTRWSLISSTKSQPRHLGPQLSLLRVVDLLVRVAPA